MPKTRRTSPSPTLRSTFRLRLPLVTLLCVVGLAAAQHVAAGGARGAAAAAAAADLTVTKSGEEAAARNGTITYSLFVTNGGPDTADNVTLTDPLPAHTTFVSAESETGGAVVFANNTLTVSFGTLEPFAVGTARLVVSVNADTPRGTTISNTATVTSDTPELEVSDNSATALTVVTGPFPGDMLISEFRFRGPNGGADEYVELYNNTDAAVSVSAPDGSNGWAVVASDGAVRFVIANGTRIPARGYYLGVNSDGYSLSGYPAGAGGGATGDGTYTGGIADNAGVALFTTDNPSNFNDAHRLDAVGFSVVNSTTYREGGGLTAPVAGNVEHAFLRKLNSGTPRDTNDNAADFVVVATGGSTALAGAQLGAPGPENSQSPIQRNAQFPANLIEPAAAVGASPNRVRTGSGNAGTLSIRRRFTNETGGVVTRLRFRAVEVTTQGTPVASASPQADLRLITSADFALTTSLGPLNVQGTTLEQPPAQPAGGGLNSSATLTLPEGGLPPGGAVDVQFLLNVVQAGSFRFYVNVEGLVSDPEVELLTKPRRKQGAAKHPARRRPNLREFGEDVSSGETRPLTGLNPTPTAPLKPILK